MIYMLKIAVIGSAQTVMGFKALGLEACPASDADEARKALKGLLLRAVNMPSFILKKISMFS